MNLRDILDLKSLLVDGQRPGDITAVQITASIDGDNLCTVFFNVGGKPRVMTVESEAVSFGNA